jgi:hypothetical protein
VYVSYHVYVSDHVYDSDHVYVSYHVYVSDHVYAVWVSCSQKLLNYLAFQSFAVSVHLIEVIPETLVRICQSL